MVTRRFHNLCGQRFGRLTVLSRAENDKYGQAQWTCKCACGTQKVVRGYDLRKGRSSSCGCLHREQLSERRYVHGGSRTPLYAIWTMMKDRCYNPHSKDYHYYGAKGIQICEAWKDDFSAFSNWSLSHGYAKGLSIDRIDNSKGYSPENCRWITLAEQQNNKRNNHLLTYHGKTQTLAQWSQEVGIHPRTLTVRLSRGWSVEKALTTPARKLNKKK